MSSILKVSEAVALAIHACVIVAEKQAEGKTTTASIASALKASEAHLSKVMQRLVRARIMNSVRGPGGGFVMSAKPEDIRLINIYEAVDIAEYSEMDPNEVKNIISTLYDEGYLGECMTLGDDGFDTFYLNRKGRALIGVE